MQAVNHHHNKKSKRHSGHGKPKNMGWKIRRSSREQASTSIQKVVAREKHLKLRSCLKRDGDHCSQSSQSSSRRGDLSTIRDQSTRSGNSVGSRSGNSRLSGSCSPENSVPFEQRSQNSHGSNGSGAVSRTSSARGSYQSERSKRSQQEKSVRFNEIQIRDYERVVGDNPSCSSGPPIA